MDTAVNTQGDAVKAQVASTLSSFSGATGSLQNTLLGQLDRIQVRCCCGPALLFWAAHLGASILTATHPAFPLLSTDRCQADCPEV
jgi:hypothetical protein